MVFSVIEGNGHRLAVALPGSVIINDLSSALDVLAHISYNLRCDRVILHQSNINPAFFDLSTRLAGDVLQKFVTYGMKVAIAGDFSGDISQSLRSFIAESNRGGQVCFMPDEVSAAQRLINM